MWHSTSTGREVARTFAIAAPSVRTLPSGSVVEREAFHAVAGGALPQLGAGGELFADGRRVGVAVVLDEKHDGQREGARRG